MNTSKKSDLSALLCSLRDRSGLSMEKIAKRSGYKGRSSVQRFFEVDDFVYLSPSVAQKLAAAFYGLGDPPITIADLAPLAGIRVHRFNSMPLEFAADILGLKIDEKVEWEDGAASSRPAGIPVIGSAYASSWMESTPSLDEPEKWLFSHDAPLGEYAADYALRIIGPSINRTAKEGSYAICRQYGLANHVAQDGKFVHVERDRDGLREWTIKKLRWEGDHPMLYPDSDHPDHQSPLPLEDHAGVIRIRGIVTGWYVPA